MLRSYMRYWPAVGGVIFAVVAILVGTFGDLLTSTQRLMSVFFMLLLLHEFEEYVLPSMRQRHFLLKTALPNFADNTKKC